MAERIEQPDGRARRRPLLWLGVPVLALAAAGGGVAYAVSQGGDESTLSGAPTSSTTSVWRAASPAWSSPPTTAATSAPTPSPSPSASLEVLGETQTRALPAPSAPPPVAAPSPLPASVPAPAPPPPAPSPSAPSPSAIPANAPNPSRPEKEKGAKASVTYTVQPGDNLSVIAWWFQIHGYRSIYETNKKVIGSNPDLIYPGQKIVIVGGKLKS